MSTIAQLLIAGSALLTAEDSTALDAAVSRFEPAIVEIRHRIHAHPELSNREFETSKLVAAHLRDLGLDVRTGMARTGVVGTLVGALPGPVVAVRADMDALPVTEATDLPFRSTVRTTFLGQDVGVAHACGHDIHTSTALGVASVLASMRDTLRGTVVFVFQPAEEGAPEGEEGGARLMLDEGIFDTQKPAAILGLHSWPYLEVGQVGYAFGPALAAVDHFRIEIHGKQSHGAAPHLGVDPIVVASQTVMALQPLRARNLSPLAPSVVTVGILRGGTRFNIIPDTVHLEGTVRTYDPAVQDTIERRMREIVAGITASGGATFELEYDRVTPATLNNRELAENIVPTLHRVVGEGNAIEMEPIMAGEDFAFFSNAVPGFYWFLGTRAPGTESGGLHTPDFRADDGAIRIGMRVMSAAVLDYLNTGKR